MPTAARYLWHVRPAAAAAAHLDVRHHHSVSSSTSMSAATMMTGPATFNHVTIAVPVVAAASPLAPHAEVCEQHQREGAAHGRDAPEERRHAAAVAVNAAIVSLAVSETHRC